MESIFKVGNKVFHIEYGWGEVVRTNGSLNFPISVRFTDGGENIFSFTNDGRATTESKTSLLSFTEYTLQGFSQERPIVLPEVGDLCLVRDFNDDAWLAREFAEYRHGLFICKAVWSVGEVEWKYMKRIKILD
jgi:hypothetical protein